MKWRYIWGTEIAWTRVQCINSNKGLLYTCERIWLHMNHVGLIYIYHQFATKRPVIVISKIGTRYFKIPYLSSVAYGHQYALSEDMTEIDTSVISWRRCNCPGLQLTLAFHLSRLPFNYLQLVIQYMVTSVDVLPTGSLSTCREPFTIHEHCLIRHMVQTVTPNRDVICCYLLFKFPSPRLQLPAPSSKSGIMDIDAHTSSPK